MVHHSRYCLYEAFAIALDEKALSPTARLLYDNAERISLARAFAIQPEVLLLDDFQALLANTEVTTIFITHDLYEALLLGDRVAVLLDGRACLPQAWQ